MHLAVNNTGHMARQKFGWVRRESDLWFENWMSVIVAAQKEASQGSSLPHFRLNLSMAFV